MFDILLQVFRKKIYKLTAKDISALWKEDKRPFAFILIYILIIAVLFILQSTYKCTWLAFVMIIFAIAWGSFCTKILNPPYKERVKRKRERIGELISILKDMDLYGPEKLDVLLEECSIWLKTGDKFTTLLAPIIKYFTIIFIPAISFFAAFAADHATDISVENILYWAGATVVTIVLLGVLLCQVYTILKPIINREFDAAKSLQMLLFDLKIQKFSKKCVLPIADEKST